MDNSTQPARHRRVRACRPPDASRAQAARRRGLVDVQPRDLPCARPKGRSAQKVPRPGILARVLLGVLVLSGPWLAGLAPARAQVLHEPVVVPQLRCQDGTCRRDGMPADSLPEAVVSSEGLIGAPLANRSPAANEKVYSPGQSELPFASGAPPPGSDPPPVRREHVLPDAETGLPPPGERLYHEVFSPAIFPYKRMTVVDAVGDDGALVLRDPRRLPLPPGDGQVRRDRDPFYASVVVDFVAGQPVPLPTPAAGVRVVSYQATPALQVRFLADGADNLYALAARGGRYRLVYLVEAEPRYFAGPLWERGTPRPRLSDVPARLLRPLPRRLQREARSVLRRIGVREDPGADYEATLARLVAHFRAFSLEELDPEPDDSRGESLYLRLAQQQRGVCRHRSYAFVVTALAAGIPARYVENELHVFVEVYVPLPAEGGGYFRRINLGGAPLQQRVVEGESKVAYREKGGDPFPRPPEFQNGATPSVSGLPRQAARRGDGGAGSGSGAGGRDALPRLDGPEDRARRGEGPSSSAGQAPGPDEGSGSGTGKKASAAGAPSSPAEANTAGAPGQTKKPGTGSAAAPGENGPPSAPGVGTAPGSAVSPSAAAPDPGPAAPEFPPDDDLALPEDRRRDPASDALIPTHVTLTASAAHRVYRGTAVPVRGQVRVDHGSAAGLQVVFILAIPSAPQPIGRAFTAADGSYQTEVEIPAGVPLGSYPLVARVKGDQLHRGSSTGRYDRPSP